MKQEIINSFLLFADMLVKPHIPRQRLIIPRWELKMIKSMYYHYLTDDCVVKYKQFLCQVENMSIELNTHHLKIAELLAKSINHYGE